MLVYCVKHHLISTYCIQLAALPVWGKKKKKASQIVGGPLRWVELVFVRCPDQGGDSKVLSVMNLLSGPKS